MHGDFTDAFGGFCLFLLFSRPRLAVTASSTLTCVQIPASLPIASLIGDTC